ncbi:MAG: CdaR family protein, partial [Chloroflexota bacterium]|nr:CdaR family protein [Chloroflexota bacterium]
VLDWEPRQVTVRLDELAVREVPVVVDAGDVPEGFELGTPSVEPTRVQARGPRTRLAEVVQAVARVRIDSSGVDVRQQVTPVAVDANGDDVDPIDLDPELVTVDMAVRATETTRTVAVAYSIVGSPAPGYVLDGVSAEPAVVTVRGDPRTLRDIRNIATDPIDIGGITAATEFTTGLAPPAGVTVVDETPITVVVEVRAADGTRTLSVGIICSGAPDGGTCEPAVETVAVTLAGPLAALNDLTAEQATPTVSVAGLPPGVHAVEPSFSLPAGIEVVSVTPTTVDVRVSAAPTPGPTSASTPVASAAP